MKNFIENVKNALPKAFESEDYAARREATIRGLENQRKQLIEELNVKGSAGRLRNSNHTYRTASYSSVRWQTAKRRRNVSVASENEG